MDTELLVDEQIEAGQALVDQLGRDGFDREATIFWKSGRRSKPEYPASVNFRSNWP